MSLMIGNVGLFIVKRKTNISYILESIDTNMQTEIFMHFNQTLKELEPGDKIEAFLYYDNRNRLCATMEKPLITTTKYGFVKVVNVREKLGCFVDININKDMLLSKDFLPNNYKGWPQTGDMLPCILKEKKDTLVAKIINRDDIPFHQSMLKVGDCATAYVTMFTSNGMLAITLDYDVIYIHKSLVRKKYRIGEEICVTIININKNNEFNGSLITQKETMINTDKEMILKHLIDLGGVLNLGNASTPEEIAKIFTLSKSAFKRAVGALYKERLITIDEHKITLVKTK